MHFVALFPVPFFPCALFSCAIFSCAIFSCAFFSGAIFSYIHLAKTNNIQRQSRLRVSKIARHLPKYDPEEADSELPVWLRLVILKSLDQTTT